MTAHRTLALREALANDPDVAFVAVLHALALRAFYGQQSYDPGSCLEIEATSSALSGAGNASTLGSTSAAQGLARMHEAWAIQLPKKPEELWHWLLDCDADTRSSLFAYCAARTINATHQPYDRRPSAMAHATRLAEALSLDMSAQWSATQDNYLGRVTKSQILEAVREAKGSAAARMIEHLKKGDMAQEAERLLAGTGWLPALLRTPGVNDAAAESACEDHSGEEGPSERNSPRAARLPRRGRWSGRRRVFGRCRVALDRTGATRAGASGPWPFHWKVGSLEAAPVLARLGPGPGHLGRPPDTASPDPSRGGDTVRRGLTLNPHLREHRHEHEPIGSRPRGRTEPACRGGVPNLSVERQTPGPSLDRRRCRQQSWSEPLRAPDPRPDSGRALGGCGDGTVWRPAGPHPGCLRLRRPALSHGRGAPLPLPAAARAEERRDRLAPAPRHSAERARRLFRAGQPIAGTPAAAYLAHRGLIGVTSTVLRYHPACFYKASDDAPPETWPALLAAISDVRGTIVGVHRTWLDRSGLGKAPVAEPRKSMGHQIGNGARFSGLAAGLMVAGEGLESVLSVRVALPRVPAVAGLSAHHLAVLELPPGVKRLYIARDGDAEGTRAANTLRERAGQGRHPRGARPLSVPR